jgi:hypothetical protein
MIKIESVSGTGTIVRGEETLQLFAGMIIYPEELDSIVAGDELVYSIDEVELVTVTAAKAAAPAPAPAAEPTSEGG